MGKTTRKKVWKEGQKRKGIHAGEEAKRKRIVGKTRQKVRKEGQREKGIHEKEGTRWEGSIEEDDKEEGSEGRTKRKKECM
jgi:hypothetical protein